MTSGTFLGPYEITGVLGAGGMGEVFRAMDPRMGRAVAIKVLPKSFSTDPDRLRRFEQEARSAGLLNHNNLLTIYELGSHEGAPYIVSELLEGETLRARLETGPIPPRKAVEYAIQIARGLAAAHDKGIVHRDLKPENLFLTTDGRVKILDFGLAKLVQDDAPLGDKTAQRNTAPGAILGSAGYMSPEQIRGQSADVRSDIFSLGTVMFEMLTGKQAFHRDTSAETMTAILREDPPEISLSGSHHSPAIDRIVRHCLEKNPQDRFQSAHDLIFDLESLSGSSSPRISDAVAAPLATRRGLMAAGAAAGVLVLAAAAFLVGRVTAGRGSVASSEPSRYTQVTYFPGVETSPSLSPDGKSIAFVSWKEGKEDIYIQRIDGRNAINLTREMPGDQAQPAFSPDGSFLAFASSRDGGGIFIMGATGESVRRLTSMGADPSWSPDGKTIVFCTERFFSPYARQTVSSLHSVDVASGRTTLLLKQDGVQPRFSPGGKRIAYWGLPAGSGDREIWTIPAAGDPDGDSAVRVTTDDYLDWNPFWSADGKWLYFASDRHGSMNLWRIAIDEESGRTSGDPERVMLPASWAGFFSSSPDATKVAFANVAQSSRIEEWSIEDPRRPPRVIFEGALLATGVAVSPDGRSLAFSAAAPQEDIYIIGVDGTGLRQLTNDPEKDRGPRWSPDGSEIAFYSSRAGRYEAWSVRVDGSNLRALTRTTGDTVAWPHWSSDGKKILADHKGPWVFDVTTTPASGSAVSVRDLEPGSYFRMQDWSADGRMVAGEIWRESRGSPGVVLLDVQTGTLDRLTNFGGSPRFLLDARNIVMVGDETMLMLDRASRKTRPLFPAMPSTFWWLGGTRQLQFGISQYYDLSRDGNHAYLIRNDTESDIWLAELK